MSQELSKNSPTGGVAEAKNRHNEVVGKTINSLQKLRKLVNQKDKNVETQVDETTAAMEAISMEEEVLRNADEGKIKELEKEMLDSETIVKAVESNEKIKPKASRLKAAYEAVKNKFQTIFGKIGEGLKTGFTKTLETMGAWLNKIGEFFNYLWDKMRPFVSQWIKMPFFKFIIGEENAKLLSNYLAPDADVEALFHEISVRIPNNVLFKGNVNQKKELADFDREFAEAKSIKIEQNKLNPDPRFIEARYTKTEFFNEIMNEKDLIKFDNPKEGDQMPPEKTKILTMGNITVAAASWKEALYKKYEEAKNAAREQKKEEQKTEDKAPAEPKPGEKK